ncbi:MAG: ATP-binding protein [Micromonosporaceae bacterium]|nr:ATP-binding protein [Micromonosporaceae bacterium]
MAGERQLRVEPHPGATGAARRFVSRALHDWQVPDPWPILLASHELVANALRHARTPALLRIRHRDGRVRIEVADTDPRAPCRIPEPDPMAPSGRGLLIVALLADRWGVELAATGKTIWAEVPVTPATPVTPTSPVAPVPTRTR